MSWERVFHSPDNGPSGSSGVPQNPAANQGGASANDNSTPVFKDPTEGLDLDDYDPATKKILEDSRAGFAALQKQRDEAETKRLREEEMRKSFQAKHDSLAAKLGQQNQQQQVDPKAAQLAKFQNILIKRGVPESQAAVQAEIMMEMMGDFGSELKKEIGRDLTPFASSIVLREAEFAWSAALQNDTVGAMQIPAVQQQAWAQVQTLVEQGTQVTQQVVDNLVGMAYFQHVKAGGANAPQQQQQVNQPPSFPSIGRMPFSGAAPARPAPVDPNAARTTLDVATDTALQAVFGKWAQGQGGVKAPGYRAPMGRK